MTWLIAKAYPDVIPDDLKEIFLVDENVDILMFVNYDALFYYDFLIGPMVSNASSYSCSCHRRALLLGFKYTFCSRARTFYWYFMK